jgi:hypothetical protein
MRVYVLLYFYLSGPSDVPTIFNSSNRDHPTNIPVAIQEKALFQKDSSREVYSIIIMVKLTNLLSAISVAYASANKSSFTTSSVKPWGLVENVPRGGDASYSSVCEDIKGSIIEKASKKVRVN